MTFLSLDLNATRVRAVRGPAGEFAFPVALEPPRVDLPLVVSVTGPRPEVGSPGLLLCREKPHLVYRHFLPQLSDDRPPPRWWRRPARAAGPDSRQALRHVFDRLAADVEGAQGVALAVPPYLSADQVRVLYGVADECRWPLAGSVSSPLALALAAYAEAPWYGSALLVDLDDHTLWLSVLQEADGFAHLIESYAYPHLARRHWEARLLNALADCCILQSRRDPRESASAEQSLYLQLDSVLESCRQHRPVNVAFQTSHWFQHLTVQPEQTEAFCAALAQQVVAEVAGLAQARSSRRPAAVLLSAEAARLPGLAASLAQYLDAFALTAALGPGATGGSDDDDEDFGAGLLGDEDIDVLPRLVVLSPDAAARGAHLLGPRFLRLEFETAHQPALAPLPEPQPPEAGPPRLLFEGRDYFLGERPFTVGRRYDCDLVLDRERFPAVSPWHCEVLYDPRTYLLRDLSREGTWVNERPVLQPLALNPGDWIRLGPDGPVLRFLGRPSVRSLVTTA